MKLLLESQEDGLFRVRVEGRISQRDVVSQQEPMQELLGDDAFLKAGTLTYLECTVSTTVGRIWQEYTAGTESRIARPCPHCGEFVTPARNNLVGWQSATDELQAREQATWSCPECSKAWTEPERYWSNLQSVLVHRGQDVVDGQVVGDAPPTRTLGFRWSAVDNHFASASDVAADEWLAQRETDRENAEKELRQFVHAIPYDPPKVEMTPLDADALVSRTHSLKKGVVPPDAFAITVGVDTGKRLLHWTAAAWTPNGGGHVIDYGSQTVMSDKLGTRQALVSALRTLKAYFDRGWQSDSSQLMPSHVWIDSGYHEHTDAVYEFCTEANAGRPSGYEIYRPSKGYGAGQRRLDRYLSPKRTSREVNYIGSGYHLAWLQRGRLLVVHIDTDHWKSELHNRLSLPVEAELAVTLFEVADWSEHREFADQLTAERQVETWITGRGESVKWERVRRQNHYLDSTFASLAAGDMANSFRHVATEERSPVQPATYNGGSRSRRW